MLVHWFLSTDPDSPLILTPVTFLTEKVAEVPPPQGEFNEKDHFSLQWRQVQSLADTFFIPTVPEDLPSLQSRQKWLNEKPNLQPEDIVLLKDRQAKRKRQTYGHRQKDLSRV
jgi:hypothetical protein